MKNLDTTTLPKYRCHKEVWALKISQVKGNIDGSAKLVPEDETYKSIQVDRDYVSKHEPTAGGYFVVYEGGYTSYSPSDVFEDGYTVITL